MLTSTSVTRRQAGEGTLQPVPAGQTDAGPTQGRVPKSWLCPPPVPSTWPATCEDRCTAHALQGNTCCPAPCAPRHHPTSSQWSCLMCPAPITSQTSTNRHQRWALILYLPQGLRARGADERARVDIKFHFSKATRRRVVPALGRTVAELLREEYVRCVWWRDGGVWCVDSACCPCAARTLWCRSASSACHICGSVQDAAHMWLQQSRCCKEMRGGQHASWPVDLQLPRIT